MNGSEYQQLQETAWRRPLTTEEQARLQAHLLAHPEAQEDWDLETMINQGLRKLPDTPLASNFTARVLRAVEREQAAATRPATPAGWRWWPALAWSRAVLVAGLTVGVGLAAYQSHRTSARAELAQSLAQVSIVASQPGIELLRDFEAINRLGQAPPGVDLDLLAAAR